MLKPFKILVSFLYWLVVAIRNKLYDWGIFKSKEFAMTVIVLGNITVGGTGKTPHTEMLVKTLSQEFCLAVLSRGYKRKTRGFHYVKPTSTVTEVGDEPLQMKRKFPDVTFAVEADRVKGIERLKKDIGELDVVLLDDAFQHRKLKPSLSIVLIDYNRPLHEDRMLPWGRLRDTRSQLKRADVVVITKCPHNLKPLEMKLLEKDTRLRPYQRLYLSAFRYGKPQPLFPSESIALPDAPSFTSVLALTGIATPAPFVEHLSQMIKKVEPLEFADHHSFTKKDIERIVQLAKNHDAVFTTEKDAMRLQELSLPEELKQRLFYIPIEVEIINGNDKFTKYITNYVRKNKRNNILHSI
ncbi:MAG: tetraacyldisaccharide 4'-kinase [Prevotellaceae bacterium]|nr:tetraacyldisaccharide 4'-kinase [Prevotellaceae bacterium]